MLRARHARAPYVESMASIVVIEDEQDIRSLVVLHLRDQGHTVFAAAGAGEGLALAAMHRPDVVLVDRMLPGADGLDVVEQIRADRDLDCAAVLVLSARGSRDDRLTGFDAGADDYIVKPFSVGELVVRVRKLASLAATRRSSLVAAAVG
jgi:DNA-binding response OmpR family regulator